MEQDTSLKMVEDLIHRARRRLLLNETLTQTAFAAAVTSGGLALILIVGTRFLEWWTLALFAVVGMGLGVYRLFKATPTPYAAALKLDSSAGLNDALSTALYFSAAKADSAFVHVQRTQAEQVATRVVLEEAVPFTRPPALYAMAALAVFASLLIGLRFAGGHGLDLGRPITEVLFEDQAAKPIAKKKGYGDANQRQKLESAESLLAKLGIPLNPDGKDDPEAILDKAMQDALGNAPAAGEKGEKGQQGGKSEDGKAGAQPPPGGDPMDDKKSDAGEQENEGQQGGKESKAGDKAGKNSNGDNNQSMLSKLKDAVKDLMNKAGKQNQGNDKADNQQSAKADKQGEKGSSGKGQEQKGQQQQADAQSGDQNSDSQDGQQAEGKAGSKNSQQSAQSGSGVGSQDGSKDMHAAEQLKAMGKISEIIGKRAQSVTGETSIEVQSGNQQLRTAYSTAKSTHGEADSDVSRDEIPVSLQPYVQQYFEQVRKGPAPKSGPPVKK